MRLEITKMCKGHDVAEDMLKAGLSSVTMVQRGETCEKSGLGCLGSMI